jgi:hypothetical protein
MTIVFDSRTGSSPVAKASPAAIDTLLVTRIFRPPRT